jgi:hypothetical protein
MTREREQACGNVLERDNDGFNVRAKNGRDNCSLVAHPAGRNRGRDHRNLSVDIAGSHALRSGSGHRLLLARRRHFTAR